MSLRFALVFAASAGLPALAMAASGTPNGTIVGYSSYATITGAEGQQTGGVGFPIYSGDRIQTNTSGTVELIFVDKTKLVVGPNSQLTVDQFVLRDKQTASAVSITAVRGAFRFITGNSPKQAYDIQTPTATIGIRGTSFDIAVNRTGATGLALFSGRAQLCGAGGRCVVISEPCSVAVTDPGGNTRQLTGRTDRNERLREDFPLVVNQTRLRSDFQLPTRACGDIGTGTINAPNFGGVDRDAPTVTGSLGSAPSGGGGGGPTPGPDIGNPGNGGPNGNAGANPGGNDMGNPGQGRSDSSGGNGGGNGNGHGAEL